jgi:heme-degrading monooxygenase HmoA
MSVIMTMRVKGDRQKIEQAAQGDPDRMQGILEQAKQNGLIAHRFYANDSGDIMVIDEWPDPDSFQRFFQGAQDQIGPFMGEAGVAEEPQPEFWHKLDTRDEYGWEG